MSTLYNKNILAEEYVNLNRIGATVFCLDGGEYYDIHVVNDSYAKDELNTLRLQEPKESVSLEQVTDEKFLTCQGLEFLLWHEYYGQGGKMHSFSCQCVESCEL